MKAIFDKFGECVLVGAFVVSFGTVLVIIAPLAIPLAAIGYIAEKVSGGRI